MRKIQRVLSVSAALMCGVLLVGVSGSPAKADTSNTEVSTTTDWILVSASEKEALSRGDDTIMDRYYDSDTGQLNKEARRAVQTNPNGCKLKLDDVHLRQSSKYEYIGYKLKVTCVTKPIGVSLDNKLEKNWFWGVWTNQWNRIYPLDTKDLKATTTKTGFIYKGIEKQCANYAMSKWRGVTSSKLMATDGNIYYARQYTPHEMDRPCGT